MTNSAQRIAIAALSMAAAAGAEAAAARVDFVYGEVTVSGPGGERPLARGAELDNGDTVRTAEGRAQLRFTDGAYVSLQPRSEFSIRNYRFDGKTDGAERGFFGLARGAMRTVTGLVGRVNRERYQVTTPTATIGIRGTGGIIQVLDDGSTLIVGTSGIWSLTNPAGTVDVPAGVSALAPASPEAPPERSSQAPQAGPAPLEAVFKQGEQVGENGIAPTPGPIIQPVFSARFAYGNANGSSQIDLQSTVSAVFDASGQLTQADTPGTTYKLSGAHADFGSDGILSWGRWTGGVSIGALTQNFGADQGLHYVVGVPTTTLPTTGSATYALAGATRPTYVNGATAPGSFSGALAVNFGPAPTVSTVDWRVAMPDRTFTIANAPMTVQSGTFVALGIAAQGCLGATCSAVVSGFFAGSGAERIGAAYQINDGAATSGNNVIGTAAFRRQ